MHGAVRRENLEGNLSRRHFPPDPFSGWRQKTVLAAMEKEMLDASAAQNFERAARLRDEIKALTSLRDREKKGEQQYWQPEAFIVDPKEGVAKLQEILGLSEAPRSSKASTSPISGRRNGRQQSLLIDGVPFKDAYRRYKIKHEQGNNDYLSIQEVVSRRYREAGQSKTSCIPT